MLIFSLLIVFIAYWGHPFLLHPVYLYVRHGGAAVHGALNGALNYSQENYHLYMGYS